MNPFCPSGVLTYVLMCVSGSFAATDAPAQLERQSMSVPNIKECVAKDMNPAWVAVCRKPAGRTFSQDNQGMKFPTTLTPLCSKGNEEGGISYWGARSDGLCHEEDAK